MTATPEGLDPSIRTRGISFDADVSMVTPFLTLATVSRGGAGHMTFACHEGPDLGSLKVTANGMRMRVTTRYRVDGSVLNNTIQG